jgi:predicted metal-binding membrane protein
VERLLKRDRWLVAGLLGAVFLASLGWTVAGVGMEHSALRMTAMTWLTPGMAMSAPPWTAATAAFMFLMWWLMMAAMMTPSAAPVVLLHATVTRKAGGAPALSSAAFIAGYLGVWAAFSAVAALLQWGLEKAGRADGMMAIADPWLAGALLVAAGGYQFSPLKRACLVSCQHPIAFIARHWRPGARGALAMGLGHGMTCLGCCWFLMALLFVGGVMNLVWIAAIALFVALEKFAAGRPALTSISGAALIAAGLAKWIAAAIG